jgi:TonB family protein
MFEEALLESARRSTGKQRTISTAASLLLQTGFLAAFIVLPLIARQAMPDLLLQRRPIWIPQLDTPAPEVERSGESTGERGVVVSRVQPLYPHLAIVNRIQGSVHINATISSTGALESVRAVSGDLTLARAALDAVRQWRFRPYVLNGKPIEVQTEVIVNFTLN